MIDRDMEKAREIVCQCANLASWGHEAECTMTTSAVAAAIKAEREACAEVAKTTNSGPVYYVDGRPNAAAVIGGDIIANAIRARGGE